VEVDNVWNCGYVVDNVYVVYGIYRYGDAFKVDFGGVW